MGVWQGAGGVHRQWGGQWEGKGPWRGGAEDLERAMGGCWVWGFQIPRGICGGNAGGMGRGNVLGGGCTDHGEVHMRVQGLGRQRSWHRASML